MVQLSKGIFENFSSFFSCVELSQAWEHCVQQEEEDTQTYTYIAHTHTHTHTHKHTYICSYIHTYKPGACRLRHLVFCKCQKRNYCTQIQPAFQHASYVRPPGKTERRSSYSQGSPFIHLSAILSSQQEMIFPPLLNSGQMLLWPSTETRVACTQCAIFTKIFIYIMLLPP